MMRVLFWKEYREHRLIWLSMGGLSALLLIALVQLLAPPGTIPPHSDKGEIIPGVAGMIAFIYGLTCGAMMLAGEQEGGTQDFLDSVIGRRSRLWWSKLLTGLFMTLALSLFLAGVVFVLELAAGVKSPGVRWPADAVWFAVLPAVALLAFAWGMLGSALCRNILVAAVSALGLYIVLSLLGFFIVFLAWDTARGWINPRPPDLPDIVGGSTMAGMAILALASSGLLYCRPDLDRRRDPREAPSAWRSFLSFASWRSLFWLTFRQGWKIAVTLAIAGLVFGLAVPIDEVAFLIWPPFALAAGVLCGTCVFAWEQAGITYRFLGNQRMPAGRVWLVKTSFWFAAAMATAVIVLLAFLIHIGLAGEAQQKSFHSWERDTQPLWDLIGWARFGILWLVTGFSVGQFFALLWRKSIVAMVVSLPVAAALAGIWIPSLVGGGLHVWQIFAAPIILLAATRLSMWAWMADHLFSFRPAAVLTGFGLLALICLAAGMNYRQAEIPNVGEPFDVQAFTRSIPVPEGRVRQAIKETLEELEKRLKEADAKLGPPKPPTPKPPPPLPPPPAEEVAATPAGSEKTSTKPDEAAAAAGAMMAQVLEEQSKPPPKDYFELLDHVLAENRAMDDRQLAKWLDLVFQGDWMQRLREAVQLPLAVLVDPRTATIGSNTEIRHISYLAGRVLAARALQFQARKDDAAAFDHLETALALSRHVRNKASSYGYLTGVAIEKEAIDVLERGLWQTGPRPELLRRVLEGLTRHEAAIPPYIDSLKADYLITKNTLNNSSLRENLFLEDRKARGPEKTWLSELMTFAWQAPWEKNRLQRIENEMFAGWFRGAEADYSLLLQNDFDSKQRPESGPGLMLKAWGLLKNWFPPQAGPATSLTREKLSDLLESSVLPQFLQRGSYVGPYLYYRQAELRGLRLQLALALYRLQEKKPAPNLDALVPRYLPELPIDPFSGKSYHYRVSTGETIFNNGGFPEEQIRVPAGQGILWSVGPDGQDNGGTKQEARAPPLDPATSKQYGLDLIFLVPQWPKSETK